MAFQLKAAYKGIDRLLFTLNGERVNLAGKEFKHTTKATPRKTPEKVVYRAATEDDYKFLLENDEMGDWSYMIEEIQDEQTED